MVYLKLVQLLMVVFVVILAWTQLIRPVLRGQKMIPFFRKKRAIVSDKISDAYEEYDLEKREIVLAEIRRSVEELRQERVDAEASDPQQESN